MRLPTIGQYRAQVKALSTQYERLTQLQSKATSGKKILQSSEDPLLADRIKSVQTYFQQLKSFDNNLSLAESRQTQKDAVSTKTINRTTRVQELLQRAQNDTQTNSDRKAIATELEGILTQFFNDASTKDADGEYIYSGINIYTPPFKKVSGQYIYQGTDKVSEIAIGQNVKVEYSDSGYDVFSGIANGNGDFSVSADRLNNTGAGVIHGGDIVSQADYVVDDYTITMVTNSSGNLAYTISGATSGQVVPPPPATVPDDAPDYVDGDDIVFNGMNIQLSGEPDVGDTFFVNPSKSEGIFASLSELINELNTPVSTEKDKADLKQKLGELQQNFEQAASHFRTYQQKIGNQGIIIDNQKSLAENLKINAEMYMNNISQVNYEDVLTDLSQQRVALELTQQVYLQLQETQYSMLFGRR